MPLKFEQPTPPIPKSKDRPALAATLRRRPGQWLLLGQHDKPGSLRMFAYSLRRGADAWWAFGPGFKAQAVTVCGEYRLYARFVGEK